MSHQNENSSYYFHFTDRNKHTEFFRGCCRLALAAVCTRKSTLNTAALRKKAHILFETPTKWAQGRGGK